MRSSTYVHSLFSLSLKVWRFQDLMRNTSGSGKNNCEEKLSHSTVVLRLSWDSIRVIGISSRSPNPLSNYPLPVELDKRPSFMRSVFIWPKEHLKDDEWRHWVEYSIAVLFPKTLNVIWIPKRIPYKALCWGNWNDAKGTIFKIRFSRRNCTSRLNTPMIDLKGFIKNTSVISIRSLLIAT